MESLPRTTALLRIVRFSWESGCMAGDIRAGDYYWEFQWRFREGKLTVEPTLGRALIQDALRKFLSERDYQLEAGGDYELTLRARF